MPFAVIQSCASTSWIEKRSSGFLVSMRFSKSIRRGLSEGVSAEATKDGSSDMILL